MNTERSITTRLDLPISLSERVNVKSKKQGKLKSQVFKDVIDKGLNDLESPGTKVRNFEDSFIELSEYLLDSSLLTFTGNDVGFFIGRYENFVKEKLENRGTVALRIDESSAKDPDLIKRFKDINQTGEGNLIVLVCENIPFNYVSSVNCNGSRSVAWFKLTDENRGPFIYSDEGIFGPLVHFEREIEVLRFKERLLELNND